MDRTTFSIKDAAKASGESKYTIIDAIRDGALVGVRDGQRMRVSRKSFDAWSPNDGARPAL